MVISQRIAPSKQEMILYNMIRRPLSIYSHSLEMRGKVLKEEELPLNIWKGKQMQTFKFDLKVYALRVNETECKSTFVLEADTLGAIKAHGRTLPLNGFGSTNYHDITQAVEISLARWLVNSEFSENLHISHITSNSPIVQLIMENDPIKAEVLRKLTVYELMTWQKSLEIMRMEDARYN